MLGTTDHYGVVVSDMNKSLSFYCDILGMEVLNRFKQESEAFDAAVGVKDARVELAFLDADGITIELIDYKRPVGVNVNEGTSANDIGNAHFCIAVDNIEMAYNELADAVPFVSPPQRLKNGVKLVFMRDPDGNLVELLEE